MPESELPYVALRHWWTEDKAPSGCRRCTSALFPVGKSSPARATFALVSTSDERLRSSACTGVLWSFGGVGFGWGEERVE